MAEVIPSASFLRDLKPLAKKFPSLLTEVAQMGELLAEQPQTGTPLGNNCFNIRLAVRSKSKGGVICNNQKSKMRNLFIALISLTMLISCSNNIIEKNYELDYDPNEEIFLVIKNAGYSLVKVPGHILFYGHNKDFIILCQKNRDSIYKTNEQLVFDRMMSKIYKTKFEQFWIVQIHNDSIIGPLSKKEYFEARKAIGIPTRFKMNYSTLDFYLKGQRNDIEYHELDSNIIDIINLKGNKTE